MVYQNGKDIRGFKMNKVLKKLKENCFKTSRNENHIHTYCGGSKYTSIDNGHKHKVIQGKVQPAGKNQHIHLLK